MRPKLHTSMRIRLRERLGFVARAEDLPQRFFETPTPRGQLRRERVARMLDIYRQKRELAAGA